MLNILELSSLPSMLRKFISAGDFYPHTLHKPMERPKDSLGRENVHFLKQFSLQEDRGTTSWKLFCSVTVEDLKRMGSRFLRCFMVYRRGSVQKIPRVLYCADGTTPTDYVASAIIMAC